jgi:hypothetical protein
VQARTCDSGKERIVWEHYFIWPLSLRRAVYSLFVGCDACLQSEGKDFQRRPSTWYIKT